MLDLILHPVPQERGSGGMSESLLRTFLWKQGMLYRVSHLLQQILRRKGFAQFINIGSTEI
jgi:hypothetical protein